MGILNCCRILLLLAGLGLLPACKSTGEPGSDSLASVRIKGHTALEVARATSEVFQKAGFETVPLPYNDANTPMRLMFDKAGNAGDSILYGDWSAKPIWYRARVQFTKIDSDTHLITCKAYRVLERGSPHFEEEHKLSRAKKGGYQKLLDEVRVKLGQ
jgi:hypothetical protein